MINPNEKTRNLVERRLLKIVLALLTIAVIVVVLDTRSDAKWFDENDKSEALTESERQTDANAQRMLDEGKQTFRFDTFGDEAFWSDALQLHRALAGEK